MGSDTHFDVKNLIWFYKLWFNELFFLFLASGASESRGGASGAGANNAVNKYDKLVAAPDESAEHETSPNLSKHRTQVELVSKELNHLAAILHV